MKCFRTTCKPALLILCTLLPLAGQETRGTLLGRVTDSTDAVIVNAKVEAVNTQTGIHSTSATNSTGDYVLPYLIPGSYSLNVEGAGFKTYTRTGIELRLGERISIDVKMEIGGATQSVEVSGQATILDTSTATLGQVVTSRSVMELPLKDGMVLTMAPLAPGVSFTVGNSSGYVRPFDTGSPSAMTVDGVRAGGFDTMLDGASIMQRNQIAYSPPPGVVEEFKIQSANWDASFGFLPGAAFIMSTKSGTNNLHGQAYYFIQNPAFDANQWFNNLTGAPKLDLRIDRWGLNFNGPVYIPKVYNGRNKTFFMFGWEAIWSFDPTPFVVESVPTAAQRTGDFSKLLALGPQYQIYDPYSGVATAGGRTTRTALPNNVIPANQINPVGAKLVGLYDPPNLPGTADGTNNYTAAKNTQDNYWNYLTRVDHNISEKTRLFIRASFTANWRPENYRHNNAVGDDLLRWNRGASIDYTRVLSPQTVLDLRYSYTRYIFGQDSFQTGWDLAGTGFSANYIKQITQSNGVAGIRLPDINVLNYSPTQANQGGLSWQTVTYRRNDIHDFAATMSRMMAAHTLRAGVETRVYRENFVNYDNSSGTFNFDTSWVRGPLDTSAGAPLGQSMASLLYGLPSGGSFPIPDSYAEQSSILGMYLQDDWKVNPQLTVSAGLRYELPSPLTERYNRSVQGFDPTAVLPITAQVLQNYAKNPIPQIPVSQFQALGGLTFAGVNGASRDLYNTRTTNLMPRFGIAYNLTSKTVLRAGYGIFFEPIGVINVHSNQIGFTGTTQMVPSLDNGVTFAASLANPFPGGLNPALGAKAGTSTYLGQGVSFFNQNLKNPYMQRWSVSAERELPWKSVLEVSYVGNRGTRQRITQNLDAIPNKYLSTSPVRDQATINLLSSQVANPFYPLLPGTNLGSATVALSQLLLAYPQFVGGVSMDTNQGYSWFHALEVRSEKRFSSGLSASLSYTWSKMMEAINYKNAADPMPERIISDQDRTNHLAITFMYELPFGKGKRFVGAASGPASLMASGWQLQAIYNIQSGAPLGFGDALSLCNANQVSLPGDQRSVKRWFNTSCFVTVSSQQLASNVQTLPTRFSYIRGDGQNQADLSIIKNTRIREGLQSQFRFEAINALNHPQFSTPNTTPTSTAFGQVTTTWGFPRIMQFGLKFLF